MTSLERLLGDQLLSPGHRGWDSELAGFNTAAVHRPDFIVALRPGDLRCLLGLRGLRQHPGSGDLIGVCTDPAGPARSGLALLNLTFFVRGGAGPAVAGALAKSFSLTTVIVSIAIFPLLGALAALTPHRRKSPPR